LTAIGYLRNMEREKLERGGNPAAPEVDEDHARLIGEIVSEAIAALGQRRAMLPDAMVQFGPTAGELTVGPSARGGRGSHAGSSQRLRTAEATVAARSAAMNRTKEAS
jgi:hypothetical protein